MATRAVESMTPMRTGPRSDRKPTPDDAAACSTLTAPRLGRLSDPHRRLRSGGGELAEDLAAVGSGPHVGRDADRKSTRLNSSHANISYAVFCLKKKKSHAP